MPATKTPKIRKGDIYVETKPDRAPARQVRIVRFTDRAQSNIQVDNLGLPLKTGGYKTLEMKATRFREMFRLKQRATAKDKAEAIRRARRLATAKG
jgi:hypothetical protein